MDATRLFNLVRRALIAGTLSSVCTASGCCGNFLVSERFGEPTCEAPLSAEAEVVGPGIPVFAWPQVRLPQCLQRRHWQERTAQLSDDFSQALQPEPPPPARPPHSRFHPLPTQPVFAQRAEYHAPELVGVAPHAPLAEPLEPPLLEEIPIPVPSGEPTWHDLPAPRPMVLPPGQEPATPPAADDMQAPLLPPPREDVSRGDVAPANYIEWLEPNPLRPVRRSHR